MDGICATDGAEEIEVGDEVSQEVGAVVVDGVAEVLVDVEGGGDGDDGDALSQFGGEGGEGEMGVDSPLAGAEVEQAAPVSDMLQSSVPFVLEKADGLGGDSFHP